MTGEKAELLLVACQYVGLSEITSALIAWFGFIEGGTARKLCLEKLAFYSAVSLLAEVLGQMPYAQQWMGGDLAWVYMNIAIAIGYGVAALAGRREINDDDGHEEKEDAGTFATNVQRCFVVLSSVFGVLFLFAPVQAVSGYGAEIAPGESAVGDLYLFVMRLFGAFMLSWAFYGYRALQSSLEMQANSLFASIIQNGVSVVIIAGGHGNWVNQYGGAGATQGLMFNALVLIGGTIVAYLAYKRVQEQI